MPNESEFTGTYFKPYDDSMDEPCDCVHCLPDMSPQERADLEREAGYAFASNEEAHRFRIRKLNVVTSSVDLVERIERSKE